MDATECARSEATLTSIRHCAHHDCRQLSERYIRGNVAQRAQAAVDDSIEWRKVLLAKVGPH